MNRIPVYIAALIFILMFSVSSWSSGQEANPDNPVIISANATDLYRAEPDEAPSAEAVPSESVLSNGTVDPVKPQQEQSEAAAAMAKSNPAPSAAVKAAPSNVSTGTATNKTSPAAASRKTAATPAAVVPSTPVSRSSTTKTDINKYPKLSVSKGVYGQFRYRELGGGRIEIDPHWVAENIVTVRLPGVNRTVQVHKAAKDKFIKAFTLIANGTATINGKQVPLLSLVKSFDGTWVPRHVNWDAGRGLSNHSWGAAVDINASNYFRYVNPRTEPNDPNLILWQKAFQPAGFKWGNSYSDSMHFELY